MSTLLLGVLLGSVGLGYAVYGRRQREPIALVCGIVLMVLPYVVASAAALVLAGIAIAAAPWVVRRYI
ncbi:hypothetical protein [Cognatilysobacter terrigena]|uniref:hypothetical protein n=1 Tax=Cognatilysobacter terrigena TaxID=2488749 RepID=UPI00105B8871|nr:hypothetical protein [Lysobacter terrigena]